jgi:hypothetical protein
MKMRTMILYGIALLVSLLTIGAGLQLVQSVRPTLDAMRKGNFAMQVTPGMQLRIDAAMWLEEFDFVWIPFIILTCFGLAALLNWLLRTPTGGTS